MLSLIPDSILLYFINAVLVIGIVATILGFVLRFQFLAPYRLMNQIIGIICLSGGLYFKGGYDTEAAWRERVHQMELQVQQLEHMSHDLNVRLEEEIKKKQKVIHDTKTVIKKEIIEKKSIINAECRVAPEAIEIINKATINPLGENK